MAGCIATLRAGVERKTENRIGSSAASARTCFDDDGDDGDDGDGEDNNLNTVFELTHHGMATTVMRAR